MTELSSCHFPIRCELRCETEITESDLRKITKNIPELLSQAATQDGRHIRGEFHLLITDDRKMAELNERWMQASEPTDVLAFPSVPTTESGKADKFRAFLGDIALDLPYAQRHANQAGIDIFDHLMHLILHAFLHLMGYDHDKPERREKMRRIESITLLACGFSDPWT